MKITTQQIKQIISEELDKLLYEEEDSSEILRQAMMKSKSDYDINDYYEKIKIFIDNHYEKIPDPQTLQEFEQKILPRLDINKEEIAPAFDQFRSFVYFNEETDPDGEFETEAQEIENFLDAEDQKSLLVNQQIKTRGFVGADLRRSKLSKAKLTGVNLSYAEMFEADLSYAKLSGANLSFISFGRANLTGVDLTGADLREALLYGTYMNFAKLNGANLSNANLMGADLNGAKLNKANLSGALYSDNTRWPEGFDPIAAGAKKA